MFRTPGKRYGCAVKHNTDIIAHKILFVKRFFQKNRQIAERYLPAAHYIIALTISAAHVSHCGTADLIASIIDRYSSTEYAPICATSP